MNPVWLSVFTGLGYALSAVAAVPAAPNELEGLRVGFVDANQFYTCHFQDRGILVPYATTLEKRDADAQITGTYRIPLHFMRPDLGFRWHMGGDCVWVLGQGTTQVLDPAERVPIRELKLYDPKRPVRSGDDKPMTVTRSPMTWHLAIDLPAAGIHVSRIRDGIPEYQLPGEVCYDVVPTSQESCLLFVLNDRQMRVFEGDGRDGDKSVAFGYVPKYKQLSSFRLDFQEPFWAFGNRDTFIFVSGSRKIYLAKRDAKPDSVKVLWNDGDWPLVAAVVDVQGDKTFFLAQETAIGGGRKCLWIDKNGKLMEKPIDPTTMERLPFGRPLETCVPFARYLQAERLLTEKPPTKP